MSDFALKINGISKIYRLYDKPMDRLKESLSLTKKSFHKEFYALDKVSFSIRKGESLAIVGTNGSGKSTLLKIITGILNPSEGSVESNGRITALLELGAGFNPEYTGLENIYLSGTIMGYSKVEMDKKLKSIIDFADIGEFINQPVKSYSSGMFVRLAFATQIYADPEIFIVDEALSVGDLRFQQKCYRAMEEIMRNKTVILVTHDPAAVLRFSQRCIWLEKGKLIYDGDPTTTLKKYQTFLLNSLENGQSKGKDLIKANVSSQKLELPVVDQSIERAGTNDAIITHCGLFDASGNLAYSVEPGESYTFAMKINKNKNLRKLIIGITVKNRLGSEVFAINSYMAGADADTSDSISEYRLTLFMPKLNEGQYTISPAVAVGTYTDHIQLCWLHDAWIFSIARREYQIPGTIYLGNDFIFDVYSEK